jgi:hypothetical protein
MRSTTNIANEAWEAAFRAQATIGRELTAADTWADLVPREYGVLYALSTAPQGLRITELPLSSPPPEDWGAPELGDRIGRAATEPAVLIHARIEERVADRAWSGYQHQFAGNATRPSRQLSTSTSTHA